jgi:hypothetical protein
MVFIFAKEALAQIGIYPKVPAKLLIINHNWLNLSISLAFISSAISI